MFTLAQIDALHTRLGRAETLGAYARALRALGVEAYDSYLSDGHSEYRGVQGYKVASEATHEPLSIAETGDMSLFLKHLNHHAQGETSYLKMSRGLAASGIEKWTVDTGTMTMTYCDRHGRAMLTEKLE